MGKKKHYYTVSLFIGGAESYYLLPLLVESIPPTKSLTVIEDILP